MLNDQKTAFCSDWSYVSRSCPAMPVLNFYAVLFPSSSPLSIIMKKNKDRSIMWFFLFEHQILILPKTLKNNKSSIFYHHEDTNSLSSRGLEDSFLPLTTGAAGKDYGSSGSRSAPFNICRKPLLVAS